MFRSVRSTHSTRIAMKTHITTTLAIAASAAIGVAAGTLVSQVAPPDGGQQEVNSITGVGSGVGGSRDKQIGEEEGVDAMIPPPPETPAAKAATQSNSDQNNPEGQTTPQTANPETVDIEGVEGTDGTTVETEATIEILTTDDSTMQSIRGIQGIDTVMLQNLEAVLRMRAPPEPPQGGGGGRAAAALLTMEAEELPEPVEEPDMRDELTELEGS